MTNEANLNSEVLRTKGRLMYEASRVYECDGYDDSYRGVRTPVAGVGRAVAGENLYVSSMDTKGLHRPALDIDAPLAWVKRSDGSDCIYVDAKCSKRRYANLFRVLREFRLVDAGYTVPLTQAQTRECYEQDRSNCVDPAPITEYMRALAPGWDQSYDQLLRCAYESIEGAEDEEASPEAERVVGPGMKNPILLPLYVKAMVLNSTSNHHLYLNTILSWEGYVRVLDALAKAGVIDGLWVKHMKTCFKATFLRPPWLNKEGSGKRASVEDILLAQLTFG